MAARSGPRRTTRRLVLLAAVLVAAPFAGLAATGPAGASPGAVTQFTSPNISPSPGGITVGPDGALWFTNGLHSIGRITTAGTVTKFGAPSISEPRVITPGPDGALWFTNEAANSIGRITTAGVVTSFTDPTIVTPLGITTGPDGALWFTNLGNVNVGDLGSIGRITTAGVVTNFRAPSIDGPSLGITAGPDGALWFANSYGSSIGRITTSGAVTNFTDPSIKSPNVITAGPDGALWFANDPVTKGTASIGRITTAGVVTSFPSPSIALPFDIVPGPDGALWFANFSGGSIGRITTSGSLTFYSDPSISDPEGIVAGPDGSMWFANNGNNSIGRITTSLNATPTWTLASSPNGPNSETNAFTDVSCVSPTSCKAVGSFQSTQTLTLIESWNGVAWSIDPSPSTARAGNLLSGVSCVSPTSCKAVGTVTPPAPTGHLPVPKTLIESWNGQTWSVASSPSPGSRHNELLAVSCVSVNSCTAVGSYGNDPTHDLTLVESWNGHAWSVAATPNPGTGNDQLLGVSCVSAKICTAVGRSRTASGEANRTLVESWNGKKWVFVSSPNQGALAGLTRVSCASATSCKALGSWRSSTNQRTATGGPLALSWNGHAWSIVPTPKMGAVLEDVSCVSATSCWAVGELGTATLVESWNGAVWSVVKSPSRPQFDGINSNELSGVSCVSTTSCEAVGNWSQSGSAETLVLSYG